MRERPPYKLEREEDETAKEISRAYGWMESVLSLLEAGRRDLTAASARSRAPEADAAANEEGFVAAAVKPLPLDFHDQPAMIWTRPLGRQENG